MPLIEWVEHFKHVDTRERICLLNSLLLRLKFVIRYMSVTYSTLTMLSIPIKKIKSNFSCNFRLNFVKAAFYFIVMLTAIGFFIYRRDNQLRSIIFNEVMPVSRHLKKQLLTTVPNTEKAKNKLNIDLDKKELKHILIWTKPQNTPLVYLEKKQSVFLKKKCQWSNCYVTADRYVLGDYSEFNAVIFNGPELKDMQLYQDMPMRRNAKQKYILANIESASTYPICDNQWNGFFNWTWTYKLNSDAVWGYFVVKNAKNEVVGPKVDMHWINILEMDPIDSNFKKELSTKHKAAAWFVSNCHTSSLREEMVIMIQEQLKKYNLEVDIFGACGTYQCPPHIMERCLSLLGKNYYFYFAFENSLSEDYVSEKIVYALNHNTVPIVFGGANYSRFMPHGIYLDAKKLGPRLLAKEMSKIIQEPALYHQFFRWKKYYSFHFRNEDPETDDYCHFCEILNNKTLMSKTTVYSDLISWWTPNRNETCTVSNFNNALPNTPIS